MRSTILSITFLLLTIHAFCQGAISGKVLDIETNEPIANASVYLSGTTKGQSTKADGSYHLKDLSPGIYELIFSHVGYKNRIEVVEITDINLTINAKLAIKPVSLSSVEVVSENKNSGPRRRALRKFKDFFFGNDYMESQVSITNEDDINLLRLQGNIIETADEYILNIENNYLGYDLEYYLRQFRLAPETQAMLGYPRFQEKEAADLTQNVTWIENRQRAYNGSIRHFFQALINAELEEEGFTMMLTRDDPETIEENELEIYKESAERRLQVDSKDLPQNVIVEPTAFDNILQINFGEIVEVNYENEFDNSGAYQASKIKMVDEYLYVFDNGVMINPSAIKLFGQWANEGVYNLLPSDFVPNDTLVLKDNAERKQLMGDLTALTQEKITEKVYIHSNRNDYYPGETIWMKAYTVAGPNHQPSPLSRNLYISLVDENGINSQTLLVQNEEGFSEASIELPDDLSPGNYSLQAYTEWMKNDGEAYFFKKEILINDPNSTDQGTNESPNVEAIDLQFLPESGHLLAGHNNHIAFRAISSSGLPVNVEGTILINGEETDITLETMHNGMGHFELAPDATKKYQVRLDQSAIIYNLPDIESRGAILSVDPFYSEEEIKVTVSTNSKGLNPFLIGQSRGWLNYTSNVKIVDGKGELIISKSIFPEGINHLTLFTEDGEALGERLFFHRKNNGLNIKVFLNDSIYVKRERTIANLTVTDEFGNPVQGNFSLSVYNLNRSYVKDNATNISAHLLLNSDLAGHIHEPAHYFNNPTLAKDKQLDLVMMTQGWTRFNWDELQSLKEREEDFSFETGLSISGQVLFQDRMKRAKNASVTYINNGSDNPEMMVEIADRKGRFTFKNVANVDNKPFLLQGMTEKGSTDVRFEVDSLPYKAMNLSPFSSRDVINFTESNEETFINDQITEDQTEKASFIVRDNKDFLSTIQVLEDVIVEAQREEIEKRVSVWGAPSTSIDLTKIIPESTSGLLFNYIKGRIPGVQITDNGPATTIEIRGQLSNSAPDVDSLTGLVTANPDQPLIYLDNVLTPIDVVDQIPANQFERIEVFKGPDAAVFGANSAKGAVLFFTKANYVPNFNSQGGVSRFIRPGYHQTKTYYSPIYDNNYSATGVPDFRISLHWEPTISTDENGKASINWFNSDDEDEILIIIEGIGDQGLTGYSELTYKVGEGKNE